MRVRLLLTVLAWTGCWALVWGQDSKKQDPAAAAPATDAKTPDYLAFEKVYEGWKKVDADLKAISIRYKLAKPEERDPIKDEYKAALAKGTELEGDLIEAAAKAFESLPANSEPWRELGDFLGRVCDTRFKQGRFAVAAQLAQRMYDAKFPDPVIAHLVGRSLFNENKLDEAAVAFGKLNEHEVLRKVAEKHLAEIALRKAEAAANDLPQVELMTTRGRVVVELFENEAPNTVASFVSLVEKKFYDDKTFYRVDGRRAYSGSPDNTGQGDAGYKLACEVIKENYRKHFSGSLSMVHDGRDTGGSRFAVTLLPEDINPSDPSFGWDGNNTVFGRVVEGLDLLMRLPRFGGDGPAAPDRILSAKILRKRNHAYQPVPLVEKKPEEPKPEVKPEEKKPEEKKPEEKKPEEKKPEEPKPEVKPEEKKPE